MLLSVIILIKIIEAVFPKIWVNAKGSLPNDVGRSETSLLFYVPFFGRRWGPLAHSIWWSVTKSEENKEKELIAHKIGRHRPSIGQHPDFHSKHEVWILGNINHTTKEHLQSNQWYFVLDLTYILQSDLQWHEILWAIQITFLSCCYSVLLSAARLLTHESCWRL